MSSVLATLRWDPTIRGVLFPAIMFLILCGSSYMILATNIGNRLGFLVASAAFWGWLALMSIAWMIYGIGPKGPAPSWRYNEEVLNTKYAQYPKVAVIPNVPTSKTPKGWTALPEGNGVRGEAQSVIDGHLGSRSVDWVSIGAYETGGAQRFKFWPKREKATTDEKDRVVKEAEANAALPKSERKKSSALYHAPTYHWYNPADYKFNGLLHGKRYFVGQLQEAKKQQKVVDGKKVYDDAGKPVLEVVLVKGKAVADPKGKVVSHVLTRNLGGLRKRSFRVFFFSSILTLISLWALHFRDRKVMAALGSGTRVKTA